MRITIGVIAALMSRSVLLAQGVWYPPETVPPQCAEVRTLLLLMDVSGSMNEMKRLGRAKENASQYLVSGAPDCTLALVASFGVTADISGAEFLISSESRVKLVGLVQHLTANHPHTNFDEAA